MKKQGFSITENEWFIMQVLWANSRPCTSTEIVVQLKGIKDVSARTIRVMIGRLVKKGAVDYLVDKNNASVYHYFATVTEAECLKEKSRQFKDAFFKGKTNLLFTSMIEHVDLTEDELNELIQILETKRQ